MSNFIVAEQKPPVPNTGLPVWDQVISDLHDFIKERTIPENLSFDVLSDAFERNQEGIRKYGTPLCPNNGRDALVDAYQENLDLCVYLKQALMETSPEDQSEWVSELKSSYNHSLYMLFSIRKVMASKEISKGDSNE